MSKKFEIQFREEIRRRSQQKPKDAGKTIRRLLVITGVVIGLVYLVRQCSAIPPVPTPSPIRSFSSKPTLKPTPTPIALPQTGVFKQPPQTDEYMAWFRIFLRAPFPEEKSSLPATCSDGRTVDAIANTNHHFIQLLDWQSDKIIATAFVRSGEMVEMRIPLGAYKLRYAVGTKWYGEKEVFGSDEIYEMTEPASFNTAKFEFSMEQPGSDLGAYCIHGNLGKKRIPKDAAR
jgi:hypothetical protein